jgi:protein SCO1/2
MSDRQRPSGWRSPARRATGLYGVCRALGAAPGATNPGAALPGLLIIIVLLLAVPADMGAASADAAFDAAGFDQRLGASMPADMSLVDARGRPVRLADLLDGRPGILALVDHDCPNLCGIAVSGLIRGLGPVPLQAGTDFKVLVVSIDPREGPAEATEARRQAQRRLPGGIRGWHFLTADEETLRALTDAVGFRYAWDAQRAQYAHPAGVVLVTPDARVARYLYGVRFDPMDLRLGLVDAGDGAIGSLTDRALLICYRYDPETGRYNALAMNLIRAGGAGTAVLLAGFAGTALWRERRRREGRP